MTTWKDVLALLQEAKDAVANSTGGDLEKIDLEIAVLKLKRQLAVSAFNELDPVPSIPAVEQLQADVAELKSAIEQDKADGWKGILQGIIRTAASLIPGVGGLIGGLGVLRK